MKINLNQLMTESRNLSSEQIDTLSTLEMLTIINDEDQKVPLAVKATLPQLVELVEKVAKAFSHGGRLIYSGAGTSGRLGILDASECPPTYGTPHEQVIGLIAGGHQAILKAVENAEDNWAMGEQDLRDINFNNRDVLVGIAASGRTPYVLGAIAYAKNLGATVAAISCNPGSEIGKAADIAIEPVVGPEVVTGSSRMKAGTAQKLVLNMITTGAMIRSGKVYGNLMVDVAASNAKLLQRQVNIVVEATGCLYEEAETALNDCQRHCKTAILMVLSGLPADKASALLTEHRGFIRNALQGINR